MKSNFSEIEARIPGVFLHSRETVDHNNIVCLSKHYRKEF
jgi:hypothetical protein